MKPFIYIILIVIILTMTLLYKRNNTSKDVETKQNNATFTLKPVTIFTDPDLPVGFGYKCQWYVIRSSDMNGVATYLNLTDDKTSNWKSGIEAAYEGYYFVSPPVNGWIFVVNSIMPDLSAKNDSNPLKVVTNLSKKFGEAYYFGTHRVVEYQAWAKAVNGKLERAYGYLGESGEVIVNQGNLSTEEKENKLLFTDLNVDDPMLPNEEDVLLIAKTWTIDPRMEDGNYEIGTGLVGVIKNMR
jgi:hypothetical protein